MKMSLPSVVMRTGGCEQIQIMQSYSNYSRSVAVFSGSKISLKQRHEHFPRKQPTIYAHTLYTNIPLNNIGEKKFRAMSHAGKGPMLFVL